MPTPASDIPRLVRKCLEEAKTAEQETRQQEELRLRFLVGGVLQWEDSEISTRDANDRPHITINECEPPVNKVVNEIENNPPGPQCHPVGNGADKDTADIIAGMLRQIEYDSMAKITYTAQARYLTAAGRGVLEWKTDWANDIDDKQKIVICPSEDPALYFCDPSARRFGRTDARWRVKLRALNRDAYQQAYGPDRAVLRTAKWKQWLGEAASAIGMPNELASINEWTNGGSGPFFVAEFWQVLSEEHTSTLHDNSNWYRDDQTPPEGVKPKTRNEPGDVVSRTVILNKVRKWVCDACEVLGKPVDWIIDEIPIIDLLGPEIYIKGKLHRLSLVHGMIDPQRALNFTASSTVEIAGLVPLSPMIGAEGQFKDEKWATINTEVHAYLEYTPVLMADEHAPDASAWAPPPQRNMWNAAIEWLLALSGFFKQAIQEVSETYDESLGKNRGDQSGEAVKALQAQSQMGNSHYVAAVTSAVGLMYRQMIKAFPKVYDSAQAQTIIRPDKTHEIAEINKDFPHPDGGTDKDGRAKTKRYDLCLGEYSVRAETGPSFESRQDQAIDNLAAFFKALPQALSQPGVASAFLRLIGEGNPKVEQMADLLSPAQQGDEQTPEQMKAALGSAQGQVQQLTQIVQKLSQEAAAKIPDLQLRDTINKRDNLVKLLVAEVSASKDTDKANADRVAELLAQLVGMGHDAGKQAADHAHDRTMAQLAPPVPAGQQDLPVAA